MVTVKRRIVGGGTVHRAALRTLGTDEGLGVLDDRVVASRRPVLLVGLHGGAADLDRGNLVRTNPPEHDLPRAGLGIEVPPTLSRNERNRKGPVLGADVQYRGPVRFADQTVHLLILLHEPLALALVRRFVAARREVLSGAEDRLDRALVAILDRLEQGLRGIGCRRERLRYRCVGDTPARVTDHQHRSDDGCDPELASDTRTRARNIHRSGHHRLLHFVFWSGSEPAVPPPVPPPDPAAVDPATEPAA